MQLLVIDRMKIKYTQSARDADVDADLALAMAMEEDGAQLCDSDDDFQAAGSSPAFFNQTLALRSCAMKKNVKKKVVRKSLRLQKKRSCGGEIGDAAHLEDRTGCAKEIKVHCDAVTKLVRESAATCTGPEGIVSRGRERPRRETKETGKRVLKDHNSRSTGRAKIGSGVTNTVLLGKGDENGNNVRSGKLERFSSLRTPDLEGKNGHESTEWRIDSSLACDQSEQQGQSESVLKFDSKRKTKSDIHDIGWRLHSDGSKKVKTIAAVPEDGDIQRYEQTYGGAGLDSLSFEGEIELGADVDEDMIICTQVEAPKGLDSSSFDCDEGNGIGLGDEVDEDVTCTQIKSPIGLEFGQSAGELSRAAIDIGKKSSEDRPKRRHNIYDILLGNNRTDRVPTYLSNSAVDKRVECHGDVEEMKTSGTAMQALVDEAELDYEGFHFNEEENKSMDPFECPVCRIELVDLAVCDREQHVSDCLEIDCVPYGKSNPENRLGREADNTESEQQMIRQRIVIIETLDCPVCGVCIEELTTLQREEHTNGCLEKDNVPCVRTSSGNYSGCHSESAETAESLQLLTSQRNVITESLLCPVCGDCIETLSSAQREEHTNACLDKTKGEGPAEVAEPAGAEVTQALGRPDVGPVVTWLTNLNLGKYVDIFVREEIDWDTLKWLTEEVWSYSLLFFGNMMPRIHAKSCIHSFVNVDLVLIGPLYSIPELDRILYEIVV